MPLYLVYASYTTCKEYIINAENEARARALALKRIQASGGLDGQLDEVREIDPKEALGGSVAGAGSLDDSEPDDGQ